MLVGIVLEESAEAEDSGYGFAIYAGLQRLELLAFASAFYLLEVDRVRGTAAVSEAAQLGREYAGSIAHASCSRPEDDEHIRREIGAKMREVDYAIEVLMAAGVSTPSLRAIARRGVNITKAAHSELTMPLIFLVPLNIIGAMKLFFNVFYLNPTWIVIPALEAITVVVRVHLLWMTLCSPPDETCFILMVVTKLAILYLIVLLPEILVWESFAATHIPVNSWVAACHRCFCCLAAEFFAVLGIRGTARLPCGLRFLRLFLARSFRGYLSACARNGEEIFWCEPCCCNCNWCADAESSAESSSEGSAD
ncbi:unnamed protein product [Symbiodinium natans]|uniref:Uncharacterized protein n=1 Tax=Symbiodinium natans TaxID=878477 RepID=A0A812U0T4_9DINO|nr:unnamed protein product [Symbiodinium natans]